MIWRHRTTLRPRQVLKVFKQYREKLFKQGEASRTPVRGFNKVSDAFGLDAAKVNSYVALGGRA